MFIRAKPSFESTYWRKILHLFSMFQVFKIVSRFKRPAGPFKSSHWRETPYLLPVCKVVFPFRSKNWKETICLLTVCKNLWRFNICRAILEFITGEKPHTLRSVFALQLRTFESSHGRKTLHLPKMYEIIPWIL
jgi:hypothetical protein